MKVKELYSYLDKRIPKSLSYDWDNDGLMCASDTEREVKKVLVCLDVSDDIVKRAEAEDFDVILSHHPLIFKGVKTVTDSSGVSGRVIRLVKSNIAVMSFHTRFDALDGGVNDVLAELLGLENTEKMMSGGIPAGRIGNLSKETDIEDFAGIVKEKLGCPFVSYSVCSGKVHRVALVGGSGGDFCFEAANAGADTFLSGTVGYHTMTEAASLGMNIIEAGHYYTENPSCKALAALIGEADKKIKTVICGSETVFTV